MSFPSLEFNQKRWNRLLLHGYWMIFCLSVVIELLFLIITKMPKDDFAQLHIVRPTILFALVGLLAEGGVRWLPKHHDYVLISACAIFTIAITRIHASLDYLLFFLFFPVMISIFYFQIKKLLYAVSNTAIALFLLCVYDGQFQRTLSVVDIITLSCILIIFCCIAFGVLARGREVLMHLRSSYESNQELLVRTILMDKLAKTDALTDAYNHMAYHEFMDNYVIQADNGRLQLQLAIIDIDNFKKINDTYGHKAGDAVLKKVAELIRSNVGSNDIVARYGGEEFALIFAERSFQEAYDTVEHIRASVESELHEAIGWQAVTISIGLNAYATGMDKEALFVGADNALYEAKRSGKNRTAIAPAGITSVSTV
ncbi:GGDEF domain-containing protein [Cohnella sp. GCM10027633]|uniref:GGDEF domain-containing protein n=1 Tax=unclassified Cohnella TaxID=2636738 RepID=UPI0036280DB6